MNIRAVTVKYLGWCPGVKAASQFLPDRDIPPTQMAMMLFLASITTLSGYYLTNTVLSTAGLPSHGDISIKYDNPLLMARGNETYLAGIIRLGGPLDFGTRYMLWLAKMSLEGGVSDVAVLVDTPLLINYDPLITKDGRFYVAYTQSTIGGDSRKLIVLESEDGRNWAKSELSFSRDLSRHSLTETKDGHPFLFVQRHRDYSFSTYSGEEWAPFENYPYDSLLTRFSSTTDGEGNIIIAGKNETARISYMFTVMDEQGEWREPTGMLIGDIVHVEYRELDVLYSPERNGFYLTIASRVREHSVVYIKFSRDLVNWVDVASFQQGSDSSLAELPDGTILVAFNDHDAREIHFSKSVDGVSWTEPEKVEHVPLDVILGKVVSWRRRLVASISGTFIGVCTIVILLKELPTKRV